MLDMYFIKQNASTIISILANIGTFISVLLAYATIREMKAQRKDANKPELILSKTDFYVYLNHSRRKHDKFYWSHKYSTKMSDTFLSEVGINCLNIGMETAKFVKVEWDIDVDNLIKTILKYDIDHEFDISYDELLLSINKGLEGTLIYNVIEYVLPIKVRNKPYKILLPNLYIQLVSIAYYLCWKHMIREQEVPKIAIEISNLLHNLPYIKLKLEYKDILNNEYKRSFEVKLINSNIKFLPEGFEDENLFAISRLELKEYSNIFTYREKNLIKRFKSYFNIEL